jgi:uncharacterized protein (TIGR02265 family)
MQTMAQEKAMIAGNVLLSRLAFAQERLGSSGLEQLLQPLPSADQHTLHRVKPAALYTMDLNQRLDEALAQHLSPADPAAIYVELGRASADKNLAGPHQTFLQPGDPQRFMASAKYIYKFYYAVGTRTYERTGPTSGILRTFDAPEVSTSDCLTVVGWHQRALELCGAREVTITHPSCRAQGAVHCEYAFQWEER